MPDFTELHEVYRDNALPGMVDVLAGQLGVSRESLCRLGIGWIITESCWTFPERDADGRIIGIVRRFLGGKKLCMKGSKRGLAYEATQVQSGYDPNRQRWQRATEAEPCPICGKPDWCGYDASDLPRFARCMRSSKGAAHEDRAGGYIHELVPGSFKERTNGGSPLPSSDLPILVVEGASDVAAAMDLGFVAVGRPSAEHTGHIANLLVGRSIAVIGDNDAGAGAKGMEKAFEVLLPVASDVVRFLPPKGVKDLRTWVTQYGLTQEKLSEVIQAASGERSGDILDSKAADYIATCWLRKKHMDNDTCLICKCHREWLVYDGHCYMPVEEEAIRTEIYHFVDEKRVKRFTPGGECKIDKYEATRAKVSDILDAALKLCYVSRDPPSWRDDRASPSPRDIIVFQNGMLDVEAYTAGELDLLPLTPLFFSRTSLPFEFKLGSECPRWLQFLREIFDGDEERIALLQEWFGYNLVPDNSLSKFMLFVGQPGTGKSTALGVLQFLLGEGQFAFTSFKQLGSDFGLHPLVGKLAAIMPDAHLSRRTDAVLALEVLKNIVGGDVIGINRKFLSQVDMRLQCRFTISANELPRLPDNCRALERRLCLLDFLVTFTGREDVHLLEKLQTEAPGIILWAMEGLRRLRKSGSFTTPAAVEPLVKDFSRILSPVIDFVDDCCELDAHSIVSARQVYDVWCRWATERGLAPNTNSVFGQRFLSQILQVRKDRQQLHGVRQYAYTGIRLTDEAVNRYLKPEGTQ